MLTAVLLLLATPSWVETAMHFGINEHLRLSADWVCANIVLLWCFAIPPQSPTVTAPPSAQGEHIYREASRPLQKAVQMKAIGYRLDWLVQTWYYCGVLCNEA